MNNAATTADIAAHMANDLADLLIEMANNRRNHAAAHGFTVTEDEIADHVLTSFARLVADRI